MCHYPGGTTAMTRPYLERHWMGLPWSAWMPLMAAHPLALAQLPSLPGVYRVRRTDQPDLLEWIGWAERGVRQTVERLSRQVHMPVQPYDDSTGPALSLWSLKQQGVTFAVSGAEVTPDHTGEDIANRLRAAYEAESPPHS
jgi:hypothetical protein